MAKKNLAIIGYGGQGGWHAQMAQSSDVVELKGVYDILPERNALAESRGIRAYPDLGALLSDPSVDIVTVATPTDTHYEIVLKALKAGKNVICEKPVEMQYDRVLEMIRTAKENGVCFTVHQNRRWDVDFLAMKRILREGMIGAPLHIESRVHGSRGIPSDWRGTKAHGGGMILDWGVHLIDQILQLIDSEIDSVFCDVTHYTNKEVDDGFRLNIYFKNGVTAFVEVGTFNFIAMPRFYLQCEKGTSMIRDWRECAKVVRYKYWHENDVMPVQTAAGITKTMAPRDEITTDIFEVERPVADVHDFYRNYVRAVDGLEPQLVTHEQMLRVMKVMLSAFRSAETHQVVSFREDLSCF